MNKLSITTKLTLIFILFSVALIMALSVPASLSARTSLRNAVVSERLSSAIEKEEALNTWVLGREHFIEDLTHQMPLKEAVQIYLSAPRHSAESEQAYDLIQANLLNWGGPEHRFHSLQVIDASTGQILVSTTVSDEGKFREHELFFKEGLEKSYVQNPLYDLSLGRPMMVAAAPITTTGDEKVIAVLAGLMNMDEVNTIIQRRTGLLETDDSFLVNTAHLLVTQPHLIPDDAVLLRGIYTEAMDLCLAQNSNVIEALDYRDVPTIIVYRWLPERQMCLISKVDQQEAYAPSAELNKSMLLISGFVLLLGSITAVLLSRSFAKPIIQLTQVAGQIGLGNLEARVDVNSEDEIGLLGDEFNRMAASIAEKDDQLNNWAAELEDKVELRTAELNASKERYRVLAETSPDMIFVIDQDDCVQYVNEKAARQFHKTPEQVTGKPRTELFPPVIAEDQGNTIRTVMQTGEIIRSETLVSFSKTQRWLDTQLVPLRNKEGETIAVMGVSRDITDRKITEEALNQNNRDLQEFAYVASHDLQEPLRKIQAFGNRLEKKYADALDETGRDYLQRMQNASQRMQSLLNDLLALSRVTTHTQSFTETDLKIIVQGVCSDLEDQIRRNNAHVEIGELPTIQADASQIEQLLKNLISNALKYHSQNRPPIIKVSAIIQEDTCQISVEDNGIGFDMQYLDRIFKPFQRLHGRTEFEGSGMGLAICRRIIERHGGSITAISTPDEGTTFLVILPLHQAKESNE